MEAQEAEAAVRIKTCGEVRWFKTDEGRGELGGVETVMLRMRLVRW